MADRNPGLPPPPPPAGVSPAGDSLSVKEGPSGLYIPNLRIETVSGPEDVAAVLQKGRQNRSTFATNMNEHSSRSHLVLSIYVTAKHLAKGEQQAMDRELVVQSLHPVRAFCSHADVCLIGSCCCCCHHPQTPPGRPSCT